MRIHQSHDKDFKSFAIEIYEMGVKDPFMLYFDYGCYAETADEQYSSKELAKKARKKALEFIMKYWNPDNSEIPIFKE